MGKPGTEANLCYECVIKSQPKLQPWPDRPCVGPSGSPGLPGPRGYQGPPGPQVHPIEIPVDLKGLLSQQVYGWMF